MSALHPKIRDATPVPKAAAPAFQSLSCLSFPKSPSAPEHLNSSNPNIFPAATKASFDASQHPRAWRGSIPFILQSHSHWQLCCRGLQGV